MTNLTTEMTKIQQANAYAEQKRYENEVTDCYLDGQASESLLNEVMAQSNFMFDFLISNGHNRADLVRIGGL